MITVFARVVLSLGLVTLPASALALDSTKASSKHSHSVAKKDVASKKIGKHHGHSTNRSKAVATGHAKSGASTQSSVVAAKAAPASLPPAESAAAKAP